MPPHPRSNRPARGRPSGAAAAGPSRGKRPTIEPPRAAHAGKRRRAAAPSPDAKSQPVVEVATQQRLQKVLAAAGLGSRRQCEELITSGRVEIDRKLVTELGTRVDPSQHEVTVDGEPIARPKLVYYMVNKPQGTLCTNQDPQGRPRVVDLVPPGNERLFTVGRLDQGSEGLMLVTNDGELANRLTHPRFGVHKTYHVLVAGEPGMEIVEQLRRGIHSSDGVLRAREARIRRSWKKSTILEMVLDEGRNREIRRMLARVGHKVMRLRRVGLGPLRLGDLPLGQHRRLTADELKVLRQLAQLAPASRPRRRPQKNQRPPQKAAKVSASPSRTVLGDVAGNRPPRQDRRAKRPPQRRKGPR